MRNFILYLTLLTAATIDHFYQLGRADEARNNTVLAEQELMEAYVVTDALLTKYERMEARNGFLEDRLSTLAKANKMMIDRMSGNELRDVMDATLPPMERVK